MPAASVIFWAGNQPKKKFQRKKKGLKDIMVVIEPYLTFPNIH